MCFACLPAHRRVRANAPCHAHALLLLARAQVGCTCLSVNSPLLTFQSFGVVILDEASQVTLPASLGPLALGRSFLLVGDHYQLSPLVQSREAAAGGLGVSLFRRLSEAHPQVRDRRL
jgi:superfamily I DNA and/or RNA helicase